MSFKQYAYMYVNKKNSRIYQESIESKWNISKLKARLCSQDDDYGNSK